MLVVVDAGNSADIAGDAALAATGFDSTAEADSAGTRTKEGIMGEDGRKAKTLLRRALRSTTHFKIEYMTAIPMAATKHWTSAMERSHAHCEKVKLVSNKKMLIHGLLIQRNSITKKEASSTKSATGAHNRYRGANQTRMGTVWS
jgi:hypothetical protein